MFATFYKKVSFPKYFDRKTYFLLYKMLGFFPKKLTLYQEALSHKSSCFLQKGGHRPKNNERLEFLGDAILDAIVADILFHHFKKKREGFLTSTRSKIVQRETLNQVALEMGLDKLIHASFNTRTHNHYIYGNALEALIGAIFLDKGYKKCQKFVIKKILNKYLNLETLVKKEVNFKSRLIEWCQKNKAEISFDLIETFMDDAHNPVFQTRISINSMDAGTGVGYSKKESQQHAAKMALKKVKSTDFLNTFSEQNLQEDSMGGSVIGM